jgi:hypothetical protein
MFAAAPAIGFMLAMAVPVGAAGDFFDLPLGDAGDRVLRAVGCVLPEKIGDTLITCSDHRDSGIPDTTTINIWGPRPANAVSKAAPPYVFMVWQDSSGGPFGVPHAERREAEQMLRQVLLTVGVLNDGPVVKAFFAKVGPDEDKVTPTSTDGLKVFVEVENTSLKTDRRVFIGGPNFTMPE